jgi:hypothetical protein
MTIPLEKLRGRIQALRSKTVANGCTEQEALSAAAKVADLLDQHDLSLSDFEIREEQCEQGIIDTNRKQRQPVGACIPAIADFCDCKVWQEKDEAGKVRYVFFGLKPGVEMARYVYDLVLTALQTGWVKHKAAQRFIRYADDERASFMIGMAMSIADQLRLMKGKRDQATKQATGRDLVLVRHAVVDAEFAKLDLNLRRGRSSGKRVSAGAFEAGQAAGQSFTIRRGIGER